MLLTVVIGYDDAAARHLGDDSRRPREEDLAAVDRHALLHAGADQRGLGLEQGDCLSLHVRAEKSSAGVVVFEEGNESGRYADQLHGRDVHVLDTVGGLHCHFITNSGLYPNVADAAVIVDELALLVQSGVGLGDDDLLLLIGRQVYDLARHVRTHGDALLGDLGDSGAKAL